MDLLSYLKSSLNKTHTHQREREGLYYKNDYLMDKGYEALNL